MMVKHDVCFDSILVRLKGHTVWVHCVLTYAFRFHTGSIKSWKLEKHREIKRQRSFDSILVRLKGLYATKITLLPLTSFDSILVRLKVYRRRLIKHLRPGFDSILVRLKDMRGLHKSHA